ncbi:tyrosine-type recombinase/integrase [Paenibacillus sp. p3-SID1389]|uniref:tyrosine-type recombinase/integrase n=1 Tax=Paenibacillus sp. p3-SID1389 TaxID=2916364 RepID=UPI0021A605C2|nr:tyrosine-type recombinase/integrase [Paenibacillus sp. p3-SID1389]MCT2195213.1 tyrosine-type recombinase/integrase [Paenibacillus sp. p3-SID1389]
MARITPKYGFVSKRDKPVKFNLTTQIDRFISAKKAARRSNATITAYSQVLDQFRKWYEDCGRTEITTELLREYIEYLTFKKTQWDDHPTSPNGEVGLSPRTINNVIRIMRIFFNYLVRERIISHSPMDAVEYQTENKDTFDVFTDEDVKKLLAAPNLRVYTGRRDYCMMLVLCDCGLRIKELTNLRVSDIDFKLQQIVVRAEIAKTRTTRVVPVSRKTLKELEKLISYMDVDEDDPLWLTQFGERYYGDTFSKMLKNYAKRAGVTGPRVSPHTFRHYFAVKFLREGGDPIALARILGHTSLNMTQVYVKYTGTDLREQHDKASPVTHLLDEGNAKKRGKRIY